MKFNPTLNQVLLLAVLLAAPLVAYAFVAPAAGVVTGMVNTVLGALFLDLKRSMTEGDAEK